MTSTAESLLQRIKKAITSQRQQTVTVLSSLLAVEDELGYIPEEAIEEVADFMDTTINEVWGVASFYTNFRFEPPGRHKVEVCWGTTCHILGAMKIAEKVLQAAGLEGEGNLPDGSLTVGFNTCLGACANGPVISVDHHLVGRVMPEKAAQIVGELKAQKAPGGAHAA